MAEFAPFDLGRVLQISESIKALRRDGENDKLRQAYVGEQIANSQQTRTQNAQTFDTENQQRTNRMHFLAAQAVVNSPDPVAAARELAPEMVTAFETQHGAGTFANLPPDVVKQIASMGMEKAAAAAGINLQPDPNMRAQQQFTREMDDRNFGQQKQLAGMQFGQQKEMAGIQHGYRLGEIDATSRVKPGNSFRPLTPEEVAQVGLPAGTSAQVDETTGKVDVLSKRDSTSTLSQKDMTTARMKLNTVSLARQQLSRIREEFEGKTNSRTGQRAGGIKGSMSAGPFGQGRIPSEGGRKFDAAVNQMRSTLTALTRVPGVGAMSDYETKLDQSKFPTRNDYESVTTQQIADLDNMLNAIETGYKDLLGGGQQPQEQPAQNQQSGPVQIRNDDDYARLPSGSQYVAPDGSVRTKR
jgi:hypothetical protein